MPRPRITCDVPEDLYEKAFLLLPWGWRNQLLSTVIGQLLEAIETEGLVVAALIMEGKIKLFGKE